MIIYDNLVPHRPTLYIMFNEFSGSMFSGLTEIHYQCHEYYWCFRHNEKANEKVLTLGAHAQRGLRYLVFVSVCVCVYAYFRATGNEADGEQYQRLQC